MPTADGLRPTGDRIRETLFNWLTPHLAGARVLDLFAGTGALGLEALSRGAQFVQFTESNPAILKQLHANLVELNASKDEYTLSCSDALQWLQRYEGPAFDLLFIDPPFAKGYWQQCCELLESSQALKPEALIYVESTLETKLMPPPNWQIFRELNAGAVAAKLYEVH